LSTSCLAICFNIANRRNVAVKIIHCAWSSEGNGRVSAVTTLISHGIADEESRYMLIGNF
jgi:hypothetical protein